MKALRVALVASALYASGAYSDTTPNAALKDDFGQAKITRALAQELWAKNNDACLTRDTHALAEVMGAANKRLHTQKGYSAFPACRQMLTDIVFMNGGCYTGSFTQDELNRSRINWKQDSAECDKQIANPSPVSLRDQEEADLEAKQREAGMSELEIETSRVIRGL